MIEPDGYGFSGDVLSIALDANFAARKTLAKDQSLIVGISQRLAIPQGVYFQHVHELFCGVFMKDFHACHARIGEEDIQPAEHLYGFIHDCFHSLFVRSIKFAREDLDIRIQRFQLSLMGLEIFGIEVADEYCLRAILSELMGTRSSNAQCRVAAGDYRDLSFTPPTTSVRYTSTF